MFHGHHLDDLLADMSDGFPLSGELATLSRI